MAKKNSWFSLVRRLFISDPEKQQKEKRKRCIFGRLRIKRFASIAAATPLPSNDRTAVIEAEEEQSKHAVSVAIASAIKAAHVAAEVVRLTGTPQSTNGCERQVEEDSSIEIKLDVAQSPHQCEKEIRQLAAIRIQSTFRGYLARKALRALKGIVKLQALIRGRNVRRQAFTTLKCLQSIVNIQSQVCAKRCQKAGSWHCDENKQLQTLRDKIIKMDSSCQRRWDDSTLTKQEADAMFLSKKEAAIRRERIKEYAFSHRKSADSEQNKVNGRWRYWLEQWVDTQVMKSKELEDLDSIWTTANGNPREEYIGKGLRLKNLQTKYHIDGLDSPVLFSRRSLHRKQNSLGDEKSFASSPVVPTYMAATESAKAKARSMSSPKIRPGTFDSYSESYSPCKKKLSLMSSLTSEVPSYSNIGRPSAYQQRSPSLKNVPGPIKSSRTPKNLSFDSKCSLLNWDRQSTFR
ncbi:hypothetical protein WN944_020624 [Citrus x changshan-huyou]|uniref:DUF4005 domain-containing protein n=1 Tax=Citrus x changshan-huyou TaxID=2935761 RepID=A0AAP0LXH7_9ROSI